MKNLNVIHTDWNNKYHENPYKLGSSLKQCTYSQPVKIDLNKKSLPKQKTIQNFTIDAQGFRKIKNENPPTWEMEVTS